MRCNVIPLVFMFLGSMALFAQDKDQAMDQDRDQTRLMMVDGDLLQIRDRDQLRIQDKLVLNDGTELYADGTYLVPDRDRDKDRDRLQLRDGECMDMDGVMYRNEYQYRYKVQQDNKGLNQGQIRNRNQNRYFVMMVDGEAMQIMTRSQARLQQQMNLGNDMVVNPDGSYQNRDRRQLRLQDGECLNMDGQLFKNQYQFRKEYVIKHMPQKKVMKKNPLKKSANKKGKTSTP
ncbi:MAG: DUF6799 domain-containing protein [Allomuricauda sp.]